MRTSIPPIDPAALTAQQTRSWVLPPVYRRLRAGGEFLAELRSAAALFMRFTGIDYDTDPAAPEKLDIFIRQVEHILLRYDGSLLQLTIGDKGSYLYASFGAPNAHKDDVDRAAAAALELQALPSHFSFLQPVQIGITYGRMRVDAYGGLRRRTYGVLGDTVNLSARFMQAAQPGQILVSDEACVRASERFIWETLPSIRVKGKSEPIALRRLMRVRQRRSGVSLETLYPQAPIGREDTLTQLDACLAQLLDGQGQIVRLVGDAGTGKSHLAAHFIRTTLAQGVRFALGVCQSVTRSAAYTPWRQVFFTLLELEDSDEADTIARLTELATRLPHFPRMVLEQILIDADLDVLGRADFFECNAALRQELSNLGQSFTDAEWYRNQLAFAEQHTYCTVAARRLRLAGKQANLAGLPARLRAAEG